MSLEIIINILKNYWPMYLRGAGITLYLAIIGTIIGTTIGLLVGVTRTIPIPDRGIKKLFLKIINTLLACYVEILRGTPMIVQAMIFFYGTPILLGITLDRLPAGLFIVSVNTGAYMSEIVRGGINSIDKGQFEASSAVGMTHFQTMRHVIIPQVIKNILPATGNEFVINIKDTSVLNVIGVSELYFQTQTVAGINFRYFESFFIACVLYFIMTFSITRILRYLEKRLEGPKDYIILGNQMQV